MQEEKKMPPINQRIKDLIDSLFEGNVAEFVRASKISSHQVLNRIFSVDKRSGKYPNPSSLILNAIKINIPSVNYDWLLTGEGEMLKEGSESINTLKIEEMTNKIRDLEETNAILLEKIRMQTEKIESLEHENSSLKEQLNPTIGKRG